MCTKIGKYVPMLLGALLLYSGLYKALSPADATFALVSLDLPYWLARWAISLVTAIELYLELTLVEEFAT